MPRKSLARAVLEKISKSDETGLFLVVYDFDTGRRNIPTRFYRALEELEKMVGPLRRVQKSVIECGSLYAAKAVAKVALHYGARVEIYKVVRKVV